MLRFGPYCLNLGYFAEFGSEQAPKETDRRTDGPTDGHMDGQDGGAKPHVEIRERVTKEEGKRREK